MVTPQISHEKLAKKLGLSGPLYLKREDLHPLRSHKGRSLPRMIEHYAKAGSRDFAISSSGNAGIAAAMYCAKHNAELAENAGGAGSSAEMYRLKVFIGRNIPDEKRRILSEHASGAIQITQVDRPLQTFLQTVKDPRITGLRQSTDDVALDGYVELARELAKIPSLKAVFMPASSGTGAQGLYEGFKKIQAQNTGYIIPQIHIVQTDTCHPIADAVGTSDKKDGLIAKMQAMVSPKTQGSIADAIVDTVGHRKDALTKVVCEVGGAGWIMTNDEIAKAVEMLREEGVQVTPNGVLAVAGLSKAVANGWKWDGAVVCVICGK
ncbi:MAG: PLP-dependent lyase/thiolase [bacterium]